MADTNNKAVFKLTVNGASYVHFTFFPLHFFFLSNFDLSIFCTRRTPFFSSFVIWAFEYLNGTEPINATFYILETRCRSSIFTQTTINQKFRSFLCFSLCLSLVITQWKNRMPTEWMNDWLNEQANKRTSERNGFSVPLSSFTVNEYYWPLSLSSPKIFCGFMCARARVRPLLFFPLRFCSFSFHQATTNNKIRCWARNISPCAFFPLSLFTHRHRQCPKYQSMCLSKCLDDK